MHYRFKTKYNQWTSIQSTNIDDIENRNNQIVEIEWWLNDGQKSIETVNAAPFINLDLRDITINTPNDIVNVRYKDKMNRWSSIYSFTPEQPGITVLVHGFQPFGGNVNYDDDFYKMGVDIINRAGGGIIYKNNNETGQLVEMLGNYNVDYSKEIVLVYDWKDLSWFPVLNYSGNGNLEAAADNLFATLLSFPTLSKEQILNKPKHFIAHSRGTVLTLQFLHRLATYFPESKVEQFTLLDPHPATTFGDLQNEQQFSPVNLPCVYGVATGCGDITIGCLTVGSDVYLRIPKNVTRAENYFRKDTQGYEGAGNLGQFDGLSIPDLGIFNRELNNTIISKGSPFCEFQGVTIPITNSHSGVHKWYRGTINTSLDVAESSGGYWLQVPVPPGLIYVPVTVTAKQNTDNWYLNGAKNTNNNFLGVETRSTTGFNRSRIGGGSPISLLDSSQKIDTTKMNRQLALRYGLSLADYPNGVKPHSVNGGYFDNNNEAGWFKNGGAADGVPINNGKAQILQFSKLKHSLMYFAREYNFVKMNIYESTSTSQNAYSSIRVTFFDYANNPIGSPYIRVLNPSISELFIPIPTDLKGQVGTFQIENDIENAVGSFFKVDEIKLIEKECISQEPTFENVNPICSGDVLDDLPTTSINSISGTWSPALDNTVTTSYTFTPTAGQCASTAVMNIVVNSNITPTFTQVAPICLGESLADLPMISDNGITGTWSPALDNTVTTTYTFTPTAGLCAISTTMTIVVNPNITPIFTQVAPICSGANLSDLPTISENGITGTWSPALDNTVTTTYTFSPTLGLCATSTTMTIVVNPNVIPTFANVNSICSGDTLTALPTTSTNSISGSWSPALNNLATTTYTFTPNAGQCANSKMLTITVNSKVTPTFANVNSICSGDNLTALPTTSTNSISGSWSPALNNLTTTTYTFTPNAGQCANSKMLTITVNSKVTPTFESLNPICAGATLAALPTISKNAISGTWSPALNNLATTTYTFTPNAGQCATSTTLTLSVQGEVSISGGNVTVCAPGTTLNSNGVATVLTNSTTLGLAGNSSGSTIQWQRSFNFVNATNATPSWSAVANVTANTNNVQINGNTLTVSNLLRTIWYRARVTSGSCVTFTTPVKIEVTPLAKAGVLTSATSVCSGGSITFTSAAIAAGSTIAWEVSTTFTTSGFSRVEGENRLVFTINNIAYAPLSKFYVRSVVTSGACSIARSAVKTITVSPMSVAGTITGGGTFCSGSNKLLKIAGCNGTIQWMYSIDGTNFMNVPTGSAVAPTFATASATGTASSYLVSNITGTTFFKAVVKSGACSTSETNVVKYTIATSATAGTATAAVSSVCSGTGTTIDLASSVGSITWQKSTNPTAANPTWVTIAGAFNPSLNTGNMTITTAYRARVTIGTCAPIVISNTVLVTINCTTTSKQIETPSEVVEPFSVVAYPNPSNNVFNFKINGANEETVSILVFDMTGRQVDNKVVNASDVENLALGQNYSSGVYNVIVAQGMNTKTVRLVKN